MKISRTTILIITLVMLLSAGLLHAAKADPGTLSKKLDLNKYHNVGNIWLRVSNYGFFGSGDDITPPWPSLEYPGGSGVDYLYQGALWFGAKKYRKNDSGLQYYWKVFPPTSDKDAILESDSTWNASMPMVMDTLVTVGFDGDADLYEFLPAYNPLEFAVAGYNVQNPNDQTITASTRKNKRGVDDDGDGKIDEDPAGYDFPFRANSELPAPFANASPDGFGGKYLWEIVSAPGVIGDNISIWFPLGFTDLSITTNDTYNFADAHDDDGDGLLDEDSAPVSEQDYISYYYDYSPFTTLGQRDMGNSASQNEHVPLNVRVRQMSYQWSYEYIKNLCYVEFDITNMNPRDTLYDCAMAIYMDSDVGPQSWGSDKAKDDKSGYLRGKNYEFAFTYDADFDLGQSPGYVGSRVCSPNPDSLEFSCWFWEVGDGPNDEDPTKYWNITTKTANEKYYLLTGRNPDTQKFTSLRKTEEESSNPLFIQPEPKDTRYLFAFYGAQPGSTDYSDPAKVWNLAPKKTMKIVIAVFPGDTIEELKGSASWAADIYKTPQTLNTVTLPDTVAHYNPPEPPEFPKSYAKMVNNAQKGVDIHTWWDNRSEFSVDYIAVGDQQLGWNNRTGYDSDSTNVDWNNIPLNIPNRLLKNPNAVVNPFTAWRLRHDFQGYALWQRRNNGRADRWMLIKRWDKVDTAQDIDDYDVNQGLTEFIDFGGETGIEKGLPDATLITTDNFAKYNGFYRFDSNYFYTPIQIGDTVNGKPLYNLKTPAEVITLIHDAGYTYPLASEDLTDEQKEKEALFFKNDDISDDVYLALYDDSMIPLINHLGQSSLTNDVEDLDHRQNRLTRRYYFDIIKNVPKGFEHYSAVTTWDRGMPQRKLTSLESGKDANVKVFFPGPSAKSNMNNIYVVPNPYRGASYFDGRKNKDEKGDKSRRIWFVNLPEKCNIQVYTLAGDLVADFDHNGEEFEEILSVSKSTDQAISSSGIHPWNLLTKNNQILASGVYLFSVKDRVSGDVKVGKFAVIK